MPEFPPLPSVMSEPISLVLIARNGEGHLEEVFGNWDTFLNSLGRDYEIVLVDDGSTDRTAELAESWAMRNPRFRVLRHMNSQGEGATLRTGLATAQYPLLAQAPCDLRYQPEDLNKLLAEIDRTHLVSGYRVYQPVPAWLRWPARIGRGLLRWVFALSLEPLPGWLGWRDHVRRLCARVFFGVRVRDVGCGLRLFRRSIFARIPIQSDGSFAQVEVLAKANFLGNMMTETPVSYRPIPEKETHERRFTEAYRVFSHPDFGPPVLELQLNHRGTEDTEKPEERVERGA